MKLYEAGTFILVGLVALVAVYGNYTASDIDAKQKEVVAKYKEVKEEVLEIKETYVQKKNSCIVNSSWKDTVSCNQIKKVDPKAERLWSKVKALDEELKEANT